MGGWQRRMLGRGLFFSRSQRRGPWGGVCPGVRRLRPGLGCREVRPRQRPRPPALARSLARSWCPEHGLSTGKLWGFLHPIRAVRGRALLCPRCSRGGTPASEGPGTEVRTTRGRRVLCVPQPRPGTSLQASAPRALAPIRSQHPACTCVALTRPAGLGQRPAPSSPSTSVHLQAHQRRPRDPPPGRRAGAPVPASGRPPPSRRLRARAGVRLPTSEHVACLGEQGEGFKMAAKMAGRLSACLPVSPLSLPFLLALSP